jgi:hypothetical protein
MFAAAAATFRKCKNHKKLKQRKKYAQLKKSILLFSEYYALGT